MPNEIRKLFQIDVGFSDERQVWLGQAMSLPDKKEMFAESPTLKYLLVALTKEIRKHSKVKDIPIPEPPRIIVPPNGDRQLVVLK